jgi:hypothetical protein
MLHILFFLSAACAVAFVQGNASLGGGLKLNTIAAGSADVRWVGRTLTDASSGVVFFDWEGVSAQVTLLNATFLMATINDQCAGSTVGGGSRWLVTMNTTDSRVSAVDHRMSTFWTGPLQPNYYLFNNPGAKCDPNCNFADGPTSFTLTRLTESRLSGCSETGNLSVVSFSSDGVFITPTRPGPVRRAEFIGDSISAGDLNDGAGQAVCGNAAYNDDITLSTGGQLSLPVSLGGFGLDSMYTAWGGITLSGMTPLYPFTFSATMKNAYTPWDFGQFIVDMVIINLGTK